MIDWEAFKTIHGDISLFGLVSGHLADQVVAFRARHWTDRAADLAMQDRELLSHELHRLRGASAALCITPVVQGIRRVEQVLCEGSDLELHAGLLDLDLLLEQLMPELSASGACTPDVG